MKTLLLTAVLLCGVAVLAAPAKMTNGAITIDPASGVLTPPLEIKDGALIGKNNRGMAVYEFEVDADGDYVLWAKATGYGATNDSFFIIIDTGKPDVWDVITTSDLKTKWQPITGRQTLKEGNIHLTKGVHKLTFTGREADTRVDKIFIAPKGVKPQD